MSRPIKTNPYSDPGQLHKIRMLIAVIDTEFEGTVKSQKVIVEYMHKRYRWASSTTYRYMKYLVTNRILDMEVIKTNKGMYNSYVLVADRAQRDEFLDKLIRKDLAGEI